MIFPDQYCLVTGPPSSGTTALAGWLAGHDAIAGFSESRILPVMNRYLAEMKRFKKLNSRRPALIESAREQAYAYYHHVKPLASKRIIVDKEPLEPVALPDMDYAPFLKHTRLLFPGAKFLFIVRDPVATINSMKRRKWGHTLNYNEPTAFSLESHLVNWCSVVSLVLEYIGTPDVYICSFGRLVHEPETESHHILEFLDISTQHPPFQPKATREIHLDEEKQALITETARPFVDALARKGISLLQ